MTPLQSALYQEKVDALGDLRIAHTALVIAHTRTEAQLKRVDDALDVAVKLLQAVSRHTASPPLMMRKFGGENVKFDLPQHAMLQDIRQRIFAVLDQLDSAKGAA